jgi:hypothetical protein
MGPTRLLALCVITLGLLALPDVPIASADGTFTARSYDDFPRLDPMIGFGGWSCEAATAGQRISVPDPLVGKAPTPVPLGTRTWGFRPSIQAALGPFRRVDSMSSIAADQMQVYSDTGTAAGVALGEVDVDDFNVWYGVAPLSVSAGSWQTVSGAGSTTYTWREVNLSSGTTEGSPFTGSIDDLIAEIGGDRPGSIGLGFGCNRAGEFHFDDARMGTTGDVTTFDFEGGISWTSITLAHRTTTAGRHAQLMGLLEGDGFFPDNPSLVLKGRLFGSQHWRRLATVPVVRHDAAYRPTPLRQTAYRWRYVGGQAFDGSTSTVVTVKVHTAVRAHAPDKAALGSKFSVHGSTLPRKPGQRVTLWHGDHLLGSAKETGRGTFSIPTTATFRGSLTLVVKVGQSPGNLPGSKSLAVKVR